MGPYDDRHVRPQVAGSLVGIVVFEVFAPFSSTFVKGVPVPYQTKVASDRFDESVGRKLSVKVYGLMVRQQFRFETLAEKLERPVPDMLTDRVDIGIACVAQSAGIGHLPCIGASGQFFLGACRREVVEDAKAVHGHA